MNNITYYILEKLKINKDIKPTFHLEGDEYWYSDLPDAEKLLPEEYFEKCKSTRKPKNGKVRNKPWYAIVLYLLSNGPTKVSDIRNDLWPGKTGQQAEVFTALRTLNVIKSNKGYQELQPYSEWKDSSITTGYYNNPFSHL